MECIIWGRLPGVKVCCFFPQEGETRVELFLLIALLSLGIGWLGRNRKFGFWGYFFCSLALTPIVGLIVFFASDPPKKSVDKENEAASVSGPSS